VRLNPFAFSVPRRRAHPSTICPLRDTLPVKPEHVLHLTRTSVTPLRFALNFLGGTGAHDSPSPMAAPTCTGSVIGTVAPWRSGWPVTR
jgi:hypothetical protein